MRRNPKQASRLLYLSHEVVHDKLEVTVRMLDVKPGRSDIPIGPPMRVLLPSEVFLDQAVSDLANHVWYRHLKEVEAESERLLLEDQPPFPGM